MSRAPASEPYNDGYADALSLVLPEPAPVLAGGLAFATQLGVAVRDRRRPRYPRSAQAATEGSD
jgi:hypothetical protein